jgi:hemerythrin-like domain-containing protein
MASRNNSKARTEILDMLKEDHARVKKAFRDAQKLDPQDDAEELQMIVEQTCAEIEIHARLEEELFYPAVREAIKDTELVDEAEVEHGSAKALIAQLREMTPDSEKYAPTFKVLGEYLKHHIKEEEKELFEQLNRTRIEWEELQQQMLTMRETLMVEMGLLEEEEEDLEEVAPSASKSSGGRRSGRRQEQGSDLEETVE